MPLTSKRTRRLIAATLLFATVTTGAFSQTLLFDDFDGENLNLDTWTTGSTGGTGDFFLVEGTIYIDTGATTANNRAGIVTDSHNFNPFAQPLSAEFNDFQIYANPGPEGAWNASMYAIFGRISNDSTPGEATGAHAATYSAGGGGYGAGLGFSVLQFANGTWRIQFLDSISGAIRQTQIQISGQPTDFTFTVDGANNAWSFELVGATFMNVLVDQFDTPGEIVSDTKFVGSFDLAQESGLIVGDHTIARFAVGAFNGSNPTQGTTMIGLSAVTVSVADPIETSDPDPDPDPDLTNIFEGFPMAGVWRLIDTDWYYDANYPWVWSINAEGWLYIHHDAEYTPVVDGYYAFDFEADTWIWTAVNLEGWVYNLNTEAWEYRGVLVD